MANRLLGIDIGSDFVKLVLTQNGEILNSVCVEMPENSVKNGRVVSVDETADIIKAAMKENKIKAKKCAAVLHGEDIYMRNILMPEMSDEQLLYNLPYEFRDYIQGDASSYIFDYSVLKKDEGENGINIFAVCAKKEIVNEMTLIAKKCGLRLVKAVPEVSSFTEIIRKNRIDKEICIFDIGYKQIRMHIFDGDEHVTTRELTTATDSFDAVVWEKENTDSRTAHSYILTNHNGVIESDEMVALYNKIGVEFMRAVNFYKYSEQDNALTDVYICGGGAKNETLISTISSLVTMDIHTRDELLQTDNSCMLLSCYGATLE